jgi:hypothetical protein
MMRDRFSAAIPVTQFVETTEANRELWQAMERCARVPEDASRDSLRRGCSARGTELRGATA